MGKEYFEYMIKIGDCWDLIVYDYYGDVKLIKLFLMVNFDLIGEFEMFVFLVFDKGVWICVFVLVEMEIVVGQFLLWKK